eukprot:1404882-Pyramimonas_sp.AAC.1
MTAQTAPGGPEDSPLAKQKARGCATSPRDIQEGCRAHSAPTFVRVMAVRAQGRPCITLQRRGHGAPSLWGLLGGLPGKLRGRLESPWGGLGASLSIL